MKEAVPLNSVKVEGATHWEPEWFAVSPSMVTQVNMCGQKARYWYVESIKPAIKNINMWRGSIVHLVVELYLNGRINEQGVKATVETLIFSEASDIALHRLSKKEMKGLVDPGKSTVVQMEKEQAWVEVKHRYKVPLAKQNKKDKEEKVHRDAFGVTEFIDQCCNAATAIIEFIGPLLDSKELLVYGDPAPWVEKELRYPLIAGGEILDESNGKTTEVRNFLDLVCFNKKESSIVIFDWKIGMKKSSVKDGVTPADTNAATTSYAYALFHAIPKYDKKVKVTLVRPVVKQNGELSVLEKFSKWVARGDDPSLLYKYAEAAKRIRNVELFREKTFNCISCDYAKLCLKGKKDDYVLWATKDELEYLEE